MATSVTESTVFLHRLNKATSTSVRAEKLESELLEENEFLRMLSLERKRAERSGRLFMLMLLSARDLFRSPENQRVIRQISHAVAISTREIDVFGWYEHGSVL